VTDTTACLPLDLAAQLEVEVVPVVFIFGKDTFRDGVDMTTEQFYAKFRSAKTLPTTSGGLTGPYLEAFARAAKKAPAIVCINCSAKFSSMHKSAVMAAEMARQTLPQVKIEVIDSGTAAGAQGLMVTAAARAARAGQDLSQIVTLVNGMKSNVYVYAMLDTLHYLVKGGRAPRAAEIASILQVKPILGVFYGEARAVEKCLTTRVAMGRLVKLIGEKAGTGGSLHSVAMHAGALENGRRLLDRIIRLYHPIESGLWEFTPVMGTHTGPGLVAVAFYCD